MISNKQTDFALCVKKKLIDRGMSQKELENAVSAKTGLYVDSGYLYKIFTGRRKASKVVNAICEILGIEYAADESEQGATP